MEKIENLFHAETVKLLKLFTGNHKFLVPDFQREYDWGTGKSGEVTTFLEDIMDAKNSDYIDTYYLGPIITYQENEDSNSPHILIDGQQRFTTLILVLCAMRDLLKTDEEKDPEYKDFKDYILFEDKSSARRADREVHQRLNLSNRDAQLFIDNLSSDSFDEGEYENLEGAALKLEKAYSHCLKYLKANDFGIASDVNEALDYMNFLLDNVGITWITAKNIDQALIVFERMNDRGKDLSISDLIKYNLFTGKTIEELGEASAEINTRWTTITKNLGKIERSKYPKMDRFLRFYFLAKYKDKGKLNTSEIVNWVKDPKIQTKIKIKSAPLKFVKDLEKNIELLKNITEAKLYSDNEVTIDSLVRKRSFASDVKQHIPLLMAASYAKPSKEEYEKLCNAIENLSLAIKLTKGQWNTIEEKLAEWCKQLRTGIPIDEFIEKYINREILDRVDEMSFAMKNLESHNRSLRKYLLLRMEVHLRNRAQIPVEWYDWSKDGVLEEEHILPRNFLDESIPPNTSQDDLLNLVWRFGNLTILTPKPNGEGSNKPVKAKYDQKIFSKSVYYLTNLIQNDSIEYESESKKGHNRILRDFEITPIELTKGYWTEEQILLRENTYYKIFDEIFFGKIKETNRKQIIKPI